MGKKRTFCKTPRKEPTDTNKLSRRMVRVDSPFFAGLATTFLFFRLRMTILFRFALFCGLLLPTLLVSGPAALAQIPAATARSYEFLTVTVIESPYSRDSRLLLSPAFQGITEVALEETYNLASDKYREHLQRNTVRLNQMLSDLSSAGWELIDVHGSVVGPAPSAAVTRYLLRKAKS
jgi:hypothetical protein